jgi:hypothetical protein
LSRPLQLALLSILLGLAALVSWVLVCALRPSSAAPAKSDARAESESPRAGAALEPARRDEERSAVGAIQQPAPAPAAPERRAALVDLELRVLENDQPFPGVTITCGEEPRDGSEFIVGAPLAHPLRSARTDGAGSARLEDLPAGRFGLLLEGSDGELCRCVAELSGTRETALVVHLGDAGLTGFVYGPDGRPVAGARILARQTRPEGELLQWFLARSGADGAYAIDSLASGGSVVAAEALDLFAPSSLPLALGPGERRRLDFGSPAGRGTWTGTLRLPSGAPLGGQRLVFVSGASMSECVADDEGRFSAHLAAGRHEAHLDSHRGVSLGAREILGSVEQDLVVPGVVLRGRVSYVGTKHPLARGPEREVRITLEPAPDAALVRRALRTEGGYAFCALEPGSYAIVTGPWIVAGTPDGRLPVEIALGASEVELDLAITDP